MHLAEVGRKAPGLCVCFLLTDLPSRNLEVCVRSHGSPVSPETHLNSTGLLPLSDFLLIWQLVDCLKIELCVFAGVAAVSNIHFYCC